MTKTALAEPKEKRTIAIHVEGGIVQSVISTKPMDDIQVLVFSYDSVEEDYDENDLLYVPQSANEPAEAIKAIGYLDTVHKSGICIESVVQQIIERDKT